MQFYNAVVPFPGAHNSYGPAARMPTRRSGGFDAQSPMETPQGNDAVRDGAGAGRGPGLRGCGGYSHASSTGSYHGARRHYRTGRYHRTGRHGSPRRYFRTWGSPHRNALARCHEPDTGLR